MTARDLRCFIYGLQNRIREKNNGRHRTSRHAGPDQGALQADPDAAVITLKAKGSIDNEGIACKVETGRALAVAGLHPATGGSGAELAPATCCWKRSSPAPA